MKQPNNLRTYSKIGLGLVLAAIFLLGMVGVAGAVTYPPIGVTGYPAAISGGPVATLSYKVYDDEDTGLAGYWALDTYTKTITVYPTAATGTYDVNVTYIGTFCTFAGALSPQLGKTEPTSGCGTMTGGYDGYITGATSTNFTSSTPPASPFNYGGTSADILKGTYGAGQQAIQHHGIMDLTG